MPDKNNLCQTFFCFFVIWLLCVPADKSYHGLVILSVLLIYISAKHNRYGLPTQISTISSASPYVSICVNKFKTCTFSSPEILEKQIPITEQDNGYQGVYYKSPVLQPLIEQLSVSGKAFYLWYALFISVLTFVRSSFTWSTSATTSGQIKTIKLRKATL